MEVSFSDDELEDDNDLFDAPGFIMGRDDDMEDDSMEEHEINTRFAVNRNSSSAEY